MVFKISDLGIFEQYTLTSNCIKIANNIKFLLNPGIKSKKLKFTK